MAADVANDHEDVFLFLATLALATWRYLNFQKRPLLGLPVFTVALPRCI